MTARVTFRQADITRAIKAAEAAGKTVAGVRLDDGRPVLLFGQPMATQSAVERDDGDYSLVDFSG